MAQPIKHPVSGIFYIRRRVPPPLQPVLGREYKRSLGTSDPAEAKRLYLLAMAECESAFARARAQATNGGKLTALDAEVLAGRWLQQELASAEKTGDFGQWLAVEKKLLHNQSSFEEFEAFVDLEHAFDGDEAAARDAVAPHIKSALRAASLPMPASSSREYELLASAFVTHLFRLSRVALSRASGDWETKVETRAALLLKSEESQATRSMATLMSAFEEYAEDRRLTDGETRAVLRTNASYRGFMEEFVELCGNLPVRDITPAVVRKYRSLIAKLPSRGEGIRKLTAHQKIARAEAEGLPVSSPGTIANKLRALSAVLAKAEATGHLGDKRNPVTSGGFLKEAAKAIRTRSAKRRKHYSASELQTIFASPAFSEGWEPPRASFGRAWFWVPLLLYYTGARLEEIAQLSVRDVRSTGGIVHLSILDADDEDDAGRSVKTEGSRRSVPVHDDLLTLGFLAYVAELPENGQLFPSLRKSPRGYYGTNFARRWAHYLRETVGLESPADPSHGFRHAFKTICREIAMPEDVQDAITGHSGGNRVARSYGEQMPLLRMVSELRTFPSAPLAALTKRTYEVKA